MEFIDLPGMRTDLLPYSMAVVDEGLVRTSGVVGMDYATGAPASHTDFGTQVRRALDNLVAVLAAAGATRGQVLQTACHLVDMARWDEMNRLYVEVFTPPRPTRTTVQARLVPPYLFEISAIARRTPPPA